MQTIDGMFSPKKKEEGPTTHVVKNIPVKREHMDSLKNIGKGFGEDD